MADETTRNFNPEQFKSGLRHFVTFASGLAVGRGWLTKDQVTQIFTHLDTLLPIITALASMAWAWYSNSDKSLMQTTGAIPSVERVVVDPAVKRESETLSKDPNISAA